MDTFSPPFEPQNTAVSTPQPAATVPNSAPMPPATPPKNTWKIILMLGLILFLTGVGGYIFLWMNQ